MLTGIVYILGNPNATNDTTVAHAYKQTDRKTERQTDRQTDSFGTLPLHHHGSPFEDMRHS